MEDGAAGVTLQLWNKSNRKMANGVGVLTGHWMVFGGRCGETRARSASAGCSFSRPEPPVRNESLSKPPEEGSQCGRCIKARRTGDLPNSMQRLVGSIEVLAGACL